MPKHKFTKAERFAVWKTHAEECFWCGLPISIQETTIDHVLPEVLLENPGKLQKQIEMFGLPADFAINGFENWVPAHGNCNSRKKEVIYGKSQVMLSILDRLQKQAEKAKSTHDSVLKSKKKSTLLGQLEAMVENGCITEEELVALFADSEEEERQVREIAGDFIRRVPDRWAVIHVNGNLGTVTDGRMGGVTWIGREEPDISWRCPTCGSTGPWSGARCLNCGHFSDD